MGKQFGEVRNVGGWVAADNGFCLWEVEEFCRSVLRECGEEGDDEVGVLDGSACDFVLGRKVLEPELWKREEIRNAVRSPRRACRPMHCLKGRNYHSRTSFFGEEALPAAESLGPQPCDPPCGHFQYCENISSAKPLRCANEGATFARPKPSEREGESSKLML